jgi:Tol biopolymer transport system component
MQSRLAAAASAVLVFLMTSPAGAQYFGRNAVQWERRSFQVLQTQHFDIHYYAEEEKAAQQVGRLAERWYSRLSGMLAYQLKERQPIILYASHPQFQQTSTLGGQPGEGTGGVTEAFKHRIVLPLGASLAETDHVLGHELVHAFQFSMTGQGKPGSGNAPGALNMPLWFIEGMAEYLSVGPVDAHTAMWIRDAARKEKLPTIRQLGGTKYFPYRYGQALWAYLAATYGDDVVARSLKKVTPRSNDAESILKLVTGKDEKTLSKEWQAALRAAASPEIAQRKPPTAYGAAVLTEQGDGGRINVGPALSPDGTRLAFLSERDLFSIELFVADARSGKVTERLSRSLVDTHLESLQFINSAGAWDRSAEHVALGAVAKGRPVLLIVDARTGKTVREVPFPTLGEISTPSFSPDGQSVAFSALAEGFTDLFVYDLGSGELRRLTQDAFADLQPAWSPDGKRIAFVTDRYSTQLQRLQPGNYRLAAVDVASGTVEPLPSFPRAKNINPQWAPSGDSLYFLSDARGATNVYRLAIADGAIHQLTDLMTGVSGITSLSPALSAAARADRIAFSVYDAERYEIYAIEGAAGLAGWAVEPAETDTAALIPGAKASGTVVEARADADSGLPHTDTFATKPYKAKLGLDYVGQPYVGAGVDRYGAAFAGGIAMSFSDMLGEHSLGTILQVDHISGFTDVSGVVQYINRVHRFNWGLQVAQIPYVYGGVAAGIVTSNGQQVYVEQTTQQRILDHSVSALGQYPFGTATRVEMQAGFRRIGYEVRTQTDQFSLSTGQLIASQIESAPLGDDVNLFEGTAALVHDTSVFGATGPVVGRRLRLDVSPVAGTVNYAGALADLRQYFMPVRPVTVAARVLHYGRYGAGGEDSRLGSLFLGYPSLVRGYDSGSFTGAECASASSCAVFDQLLGSRLLVGNLEVRAPLLGLFGAKRLYGPLPIDVGAFFDAGVAWDSASSPADRSLVRSVGGTARLNLFGAAVLQLDYVKPLDRPGKSPYFTFNLLSGF